MASCGYCKTSIMMGGKRQGDQRFCNGKCMQNAQLVSAANLITAEAVNRRVQWVHLGNCPKCQGQGPVNVHTSHRVWSALLMTFWSSRPAMRCQSCGTKKIWGDTLFSAAFGWWGFPWGLIFTPVQIVRNLIALLHKPNPVSQAAALERMVRLDMASRKCSNAAAVASELTDFAVWQHNATRRAGTCRVVTAALMRCTTTAVQIGQACQRSQACLSRAGCVPH